MTDIAQQYLDLIGDWQDPNPRPEIVEHEGYYVVRDDLIPVGTKARGGDYIIGHDPANKDVQEWVYGSSPATGYAQVSLPYVCNKYNKKAVIFMAERTMDKLHPYQKRGLELGAEYHWVPNGMLNVTQKRAKDYVEKSPDTRRLLPIGLDHPTVLGCIIRSARTLSIHPDEVWSVGSSGTLSRALQMAFPNATVHVVSSGGHKMGPSSLGRAIFHPTKYRFDQEVRKEELPPFPSPPAYDAKAWAVMKRYYEENDKPKTVLFWNVAA